MKRNFNLLAWFFKLISGVLNGAERAILDFLSALVPWAVPVIPAYLTFYHTTEQMGFPSWVAWTSAFVVEVLGLVSVATAIRFFINNQRYKDNKNKAPFKLAVGVYAFYILIVLVVNVVLEWVAGTRTGWIILAIALFSLLSLPSGVLISIRVQYSEMLEDREERYSHKPNQPAQKQKFASDYREQIVSMLKDTHAQTGQWMTPKEVSARLKLDNEKSKGYISTITSELKKGDNGFTF